MKRIVIFLVLCLSALNVFSQSVGDVNGDGEITITDVMALVNIVTGYNTNYDLQVADLNYDGEVTVTDVIILVNIIVGNQTPIQPDDEDVDAIYINYADGGVTYKIPKAWKQYVTVTTNGGNVDVVNTNTEEEYVVSLNGTCNSGSFNYTGSFKTTIILNGVTLVNPNGGCIDIEDGKRVKLQLADGTQNVLKDGDGSQKAALYCKGHLEIGGGGSLSVEGNAKHAIRAKEYIEVKKSTGTITILSAQSDGIHAGQYFEMKGGEIVMDNVLGDGVQVEALSEGDDYDGQMIISGGKISVTLIGSDAAALKSDSLMTISGGEIVVQSTGDDVKGLKSKTDIWITGGTINVTQSGGYLISEVTEDDNTFEDASYNTAIRSTGDIIIDGGDITINNSSDGGRGISSDGSVKVTNGTLTVNTLGKGGILDLNNTSPTVSHSYRVYVTLPTSNNGGQSPGGGGGGRSAWTNVYLYNSSNELVAQLTQQASFTANGQTATFYYHDFGEPVSGTYYFMSDDYKSSRPGSSTTYTIKSSNFDLNLDGSDAFYSISNNYSTSGTTRTYSISNVTSTYADASTAAEEGETYKAFCMKASVDVVVDGGTMNLHHNGLISKGIKADQNVYINGGIISDTAEGGYMIIGTDPSYCTAIKCQNYIGEGGELTIVATGDASRGISADGTITINDGAYDISLSGDGATYTGNGSTEGAGARGLKSDGNMTLKGGTINIVSSARGGKGIKVGNSGVSGLNAAKLVIGNDVSTNQGPIMTVTTTGSYLSKSGSGGGMWGGGMDEGFIGSCKAIKCMGPVEVYGGNIYLSTSQDSGEGLESKSTITFYGGTIESSTYDDAINAASTITFNGGNVWAHASKNDAIDSNDHTTGIVINDGLVIASGTSSPEEGFDCDNAAFILNGGTVIGTGGSQGGGGQGGGGKPTTATQAYATLSSVSLTASTYLSLKDSSGNVVFSYKLPNSTTNSTVLVSCPSFSSGSTATIVYGSTAANNPATSLWNGAYTTGATIVGGTTRNVTARK